MENLLRDIEDQDIYIDDLSFIWAGMVQDA